ncbi:L-seryl-tRNA(Sec) kinase, partial [Clarias magur]
AGWKQHRQAVLECLDDLLQELTADTPHTHTGAGGGGSVCERFKVAKEEQQILSVLQDTHSGPRRLALLLDDNFYYHSMRYQVFQLARRRSAGFCQLYLRCPLEVCLHRNRVRGQPVSDDVITEMANRMEPPNSEKNPWEKNSVTVDTTHTVTHTHIQELLQVISSAVENPLSPVQDDSEQREADRQRCACSVLHQVDQVCRRLVSQAMLTAR